MLQRFTGPFLVAVAALLWATDSVFRSGLLKDLSPIEMVFIEHLVGVIFLLPFLFFRFSQFFQVTLSHFIALGFIGVFASGLATVFFTQSFQYVNPSVAILLQKLQPILTTLFAYVLLKEKMSKVFFLWAGIALVAAMGMSFPDFDFSFMQSFTLRSKGILYAFLAAVIWALATVVGKNVLKKETALVATFWRFLFGAVSLFMLMGYLRIPLRVAPLLDHRALLSVVYLSLIPGLLSIFLYYSGLKKTRASVATFAELLFPIGAVLLNAYFLGDLLTLTQVVFGVILLFSVTMISLSKSMS